LHQCPGDDDNRERADSKTITELSFDAVIQHRADEFFSDDERRYKHSIYADAKFHRAIRIIHKKHRMIKPTIRYIAIKAGMIRLNLTYASQMAIINQLIEVIDNNPVTAGGIEVIPAMSITQAGKTKECASGFTHGEHDKIEDITEAFGLNNSSFLIVAFWISREDTGSGT
jgi:hypothetical protein